MTVKIKLSLKERDLGLKHILREVKKLGRKPSVDIGIRGNTALAQKKGSKDNVQLVDVATIHEYGAPNAPYPIPERSFIRSTMAEHGDYADIATAFVKEILDPSGKMTTEKALALIGEVVKKDIQAKIRTNIPPPLAASTIAGRAEGGDSGSPIALIDTGQLIQGISYKVNKSRKE